MPSAPLGLCYTYCMEETELRQRLEAIEQKLEATYRSAEKTRKYFLGVIVVSIVALVVPLIGIAFELPTLLASYSSLSGM